MRQCPVTSLNELKGWKLETLGNIFQVSILFLQKSPKNDKQGNMGKKEK